MARLRSKRRAQKDAARKDQSGRLISLKDPAGIASEAYRVLRTNLFYALVDTPPRVVAVTSPGSAEGKSTTCANLGAVLAQAEKSTLVLDCDFRNPVMHKIFGLRNIHGLVNVLVGEYDLEEVWQEPLPKLKVVTGGSIPPNPAELLSSRRFSEFVDRVRKQFDYVLLDAPPVEPVSDAAVIAAQADGTLLVIDTQGTRKGSLRQTVRSLETVGADILGVVMNKVEPSKGSYYASSYTYGG